VYVKKCKKGSSRGDVEAKAFYIGNDDMKVEVKPDVFTTAVDILIINEKKYNSKFARYLIAPFSLYSIHYLSENDTITVGGMIDI